jgi:hypothetical protein
MEASVTEALAAMKWIEPSDRAVVDLALTYARQIDTFLRSDDAQVNSKGIYLGPHLLRALTELGGTPIVRLRHELRSLKPDGKPSDAAGDDDAGAQPRATVTPIKRPAKRHTTA